MSFSLGGPCLWLCESHINRGPEGDHHIVKVSNSDHATGRLSAIQRRTPGGSSDDNIPQDLLQVLGSTHTELQGHNLDRRVSRWELDNLEPTTLHRLEMLDRNSRTDLTINETHENSFIIVHWSSIVIYSTILGIVIFMMILWRLTKAKWLRRYLARKCGCHDEPTTVIEMKPKDTTVSLADALNQIEDQMPGTNATSKSTNRSLHDRWRVREDEIRTFKDLQRTVEEERAMLERPLE